MTKSIPAKDVQLFLIELEDEFEQRLREIVEADPIMKRVDVTMGFTKNRNSTATESVVRGDFHPIDNEGDKPIIVYSLAKYVRFGLLYDETSYICQPIDIDELKEIVLSAPTEGEQYDRAHRMIEELDKLLGKLD